MRELKNLQADLSLWHVTTLPITKTISGRAVRLVEEHFLARNLQLADALIASTAIEHKLTIVTSNTKHFQSVKTLQDRGVQAPVMNSACSNGHWGDRLWHSEGAAESESVGAASHTVHCPG